MKFSSTVCAIATVTVAGLGWPLASPANQPPAKARLANFDKRQEPRQPGAAGAVPADRADAVARLHRRLPAAKVSFDEIVGSPKFVSTMPGFLTGPNGRGRGVAAEGAAGVRGDDPHRAVKAFLAEHRGLFGHGPEALDRATVTREFTAAHNGMKTVVWQQEVDGISVFEAVLTAHTTKNEELVNLASQFVPEPEQAANAGVANRAVQAARPDVSAEQAIVLAAKSTADNVLVAGIKAVGGPFGVTKAQTFNVEGLKGETRVQLVWLPVERARMKLCWDVTLASRAQGEVFRVLIDVGSGEALLRRSLTEYISNATYRVYTSDSPSPFSPGHPTPATNQPPTVPRVLIVTNALNTNASPNGWINDGVNETRGNNVDAHTDRNADDQADLPRPQGSPLREFDFPLDLAQSPASYSAASVVQLFYWNNWMHDRLYELGFTEAAGNFQISNFGRGGMGNDAVQADAQDGEGFNNANMSTPSDGSAPRMQMFLFDGPNPDRDGDLDAEVILHEYTHGLSNRRVGGGVGISALQSRGMGEGWSDFYALSLLSESGDDVDGVYAAGGYLCWLLSGLRENYYYGIRRYPYSTDLNKNPLTFKDIDPAQAQAHTNAPLSPNDRPFSPALANEVHSQGEVWCVTLWDVRANLIHKHGYAGNQLMLQLVTDGMNLSPANPNFLQARDAILQADLVLTGGANQNELWAAFAKRGLGFSATSPASSTTSGVRESFDLPDDLRLAPSEDFIARGPVGGPFTPAQQEFTLSNAGTNPVVWTARKTAPWFEVAPAGGTIAPGAPPVTVSVALNPLADSLAMGVHADTIVFSNATTRLAQRRQARLRAGLIDDLTESFDGGDNDLDFQSFLFTPDAGGTSYTVCREPASEFFTDPAGGRNVTLSDDSWAPMTLTNATLTLFGRGTNVWFIGSNGYLTPGEGDSRYDGSIATHFNLPRVSGLFADLNPGVGGQVSWRQLSNRVAVTFLRVPEYASTRTNSLQIEMFFDGNIRLTYLRLETTSGLVGLSRGAGVPDLFEESDFSSYGPCGLPMRLVLPAGVNEDAGLLSAAGQIQLETPTATNLVITLASSDVTEVIVPASVTVPPGATNASFGIVAMDDSELDGTQVASITASAPGFKNAFASLRVFDTEPATLALSLPASAREGDGLVAGMVSVSAVPDAPILVTLVSSDPGEMVASSALIPAGQTSGVVHLTVVDDGRLDGPRLVTLQAHVENWTDASASLEILDNETTDLTLVLPARVREDAGTLTNRGEVRLTGTLTTNLVVALSAAPAGVLTVAESVTVPSGSVSGFFDLTLVDDAVVDGAQVATVTAGTGGFTSGNATMIVLDDESPPDPVNPQPPHLATNVSAEVNLAWEQEEENLDAVHLSPAPPPGTSFDVRFGTNPTPGPAELLGSTTNRTWDLPRLAPDTTYYWQIVARRVGVTAGPVWQFTTRGVSAFAWSPIASPQIWNTPFVAAITARDEFGTAVTNFAGPVVLEGLGPDGGGIGISPTNTGGFTNGVWSGELTVREPADTVNLRASHSAILGASNPFEVVALNDVAVRIAGAPNPAGLGANLLHTIVVTNSGPNTATAVTLTNPLPAGVTFVSATPSQGSCAAAGSEVVCSLGNLAGAAHASVVLVTVPNVAGTITNRVTIARGEADSFAPNNTAAAITTVLPPTLTIQNVSVIEGNSGTTDALFVVSLFGVISEPVTVGFATSNGTARAGADFVDRSGVLTFAPGTTQQVVIVPVLGEETTEQDETFTVQLFSAINATLGQATGTATILNDDQPVAVTLPFVEDWESGGFGRHWILSGTQNFRSQVTRSNVPHAGSFHMTMDAAPDGRSRNEVTVLIDPTGWTNLLLRFWAVGYGEDPDGPPPSPFPNGADFDGVALSADGTNWFEVQGLRNLAPSYSEYVVDLDAAFIGFGLSYGSPFRLRFNQVDDFGIPTDGIGIDDISVTGQPLGIIIDHITLLTESCGPNHAIDPGETVTVNVALRNQGGPPTTNVMATLLAGAGVLAPSGPQSYGALVSGEPAVERTFAFTADGPCGAFVRPVLQLTDGANPLGAQTAAFPIGFVRTNSYVFALTNVINIPPSGSAVPYPSTRAIAGVTGAISRLTVTLHGLSHDAPEELEVLLVGPANQTVMLMSDAGSVNPLNDVTLTFDSAAVESLPQFDPIASGTYRPTDYFPGDFLPSPAPALPHGSSLSVFNGANANGSWRLFIYDSLSSLTAGRLARGWTLNLETTTNQCCFDPAAVDLAVGVAPPPSPATLDQMLTYTLTTINRGPATATLVSVTNTLPAGVVFLSAVPTQGTCTHDAGIVTCLLGNLASNAVAQVTLSVRPEIPGVLSNVVDVATMAPDFNLANNHFVTATTVRYPAITTTSASYVESATVPTNVLLNVLVSVSQTRTASVSYVTADRTATAGLDYVPAGGELIFLPGETSKTIPLTLLADPLDESNETFVVILSNPINLFPTTNQIVVTIIDTDVPSAFSVNDFSVPEGNAGLTPATFAVRLAPVSGQEVRVNFATASGSAVAPSDYVPTNGTLIFPPGTTNRTVTFLVRGDVTNELNETVFLNLTGPFNASLADSQGICTILNDDPLPTIVLNAAAIVTEGCRPTNGVVDPGETVRVNVSLRNLSTGGARTTSLTATLLPTGGIVDPSAPQLYGEMTNATPVARPFVFTADGVCGDSVTATFQLQDGPVSLGTATTVFSLGRSGRPLVEGFDGVNVPALPAGWTVQNTGGDQPWVTTNNLRDTLPNAAFASNPGFTSSKLLQSPAFFVATPTAELTFRHSYNTESCCDGGTLAIALGNGPFTDILEAGGAFVSGGYNGIIDRGPAWAGDSLGFVTVVATLPPSAAGQNVRLQWNFSSDGSVSDVGWHVDSIAVTDGQPACCVAEPLAIESIAVTGNLVTVQWRSQPGARYRVQYRAALDAGAWLDLPGDVTATGETAAKTDTLSEAQRFYRVVLLP